MDLPTNIEKLVYLFLRQVEDSKDGHFSLENRARLIRLLTGIEEKPDFNSNLEFYSSPNVKPKELIFWLALLTAEKVLPIWEKADVFQFDKGDSFKFLPYQIISLAKSLITGKVDFKVAETKLNGDYYYMPMTMAELTTLEVYRVIECAISALSIPIYGIEPRLLINDFASLACDAYAGKDENPPGFFYKFTLSRMNIEIQTYLYASETKTISALFEKFGSKDLLEISDFLGIATYQWSEEEKSLVKNYKPFRLNDAKSLAFWHWWLTEAIPQAWELTQQSASK